MATLSLFSKRKLGLFSQDLTVWGKDDKLLYYTMDLRQLWAVPIDTAPRIKFGDPQHITDLGAQSSIHIIIYGTCDCSMSQRGHEVRWCPDENW